MKPSCQVCSQCTKEIDFTMGPKTEDYSLFMQGQRYKLVPSRKYWQHHLNERQRHDSKVSATATSGQRFITGLKHPAIVTYPLSYLAIYHMRHVKMLVILCDPLRRIEKIFMYWNLRLCSIHASRCVGLQGVLGAPHSPTTTQWPVGLVSPQSCWEALGALGTGPCCGLVFPWLVTEFEELPGKPSVGRFFNSSGSVINELE